jgi:hypothetical protein
MPKINKVYPPFFNGVTQQNPELALDSQCKEMTNCVPDLVSGLTKRPPTKFQRLLKNSEVSYADTATIFHTYDRGEDDEEYIMLETGEASDPVRVFNKSGDEMVVTYNSTNQSEIKTYLSQGNLKGLTVQDRTWVFSKTSKVDLDYTATAPLAPNYTKEAFYWLKRGSGDRYNPFNYAVYLNGTTYAVDPNKPSNETADPGTGAEDSDVAAQLLTNKINAGGLFTATVIGSLIKIVKVGGGDFEFSSWDSWGNQASEGWKGTVNKITDLPKDMPFSNVYVKIVGDENNTFTDYYVKWNGSSWEECLDPTADRGQLTNMPVKMDRTSLVGGVATFTFDLVDWSLPRVGNDENNPDPSFVNQKVQDLFFYKNRLGIASEDSVTLTETANYTNFYASTVTDIVDTDVIDVTIATNQASKIYYAKPFNNSLYIFTKYSQYELVGEGIFSPSTVSLSNTTNYPMATDVEPVVMNDSLYFISTTDNQQQLREYIKTDNLNVKGVDLNVSTPTYLSEPIKHLVVDGVLGYVLCCTATNIVYLYNFKEDGTKRVQSAWSKWQLLEGLTTEANSFEYYSLGSTVVVTYKTAADYRYNSLQLDYNVVNDNVDTTSNDGSTIVSVPYTSSVLLPDYYPQLTGIRTPMNKVLIKKVTVEGEGNFDATVYRKDYDTTYTKLHTDSMRDLDLHISSKVGNVDITIQDSTENDFKLSSIVLEAMLAITSKELK